MPIGAAQARDWRSQRLNLRSGATGSIPPGRFHVLGVFPTPLPKLPGSASAPLCIVVAITWPPGSASAPYGGHAAGAAARLAVNCLRAVNFVVAPVVVPKVVQ